jgi:hypothetical protein
MTRLFILLSVVGFLPACSVSTLYGPGYYSETKVGDKLSRVTFRGGDHPLTGDLCLLRCADVTLEAGYTHFQVVDSESGSSMDKMPSIYPFNHHHHGDDPFFRDIAFVTKTIRFLSSELDNGFAYNASEVSRSMRRKYEID